LSAEAFLYVKRIPIFNGRASPHVSIRHPVSVAHHSVRHQVTNYCLLQYFLNIPDYETPRACEKQKFSDNTHISWCTSLGEGFEMFLTEATDDCVVQQVWETGN
jgi:hypothetical protein